ncbi:sulfate adenylyltransferase subunit CysN [Polynucleobacter paneuropaeus]|nr:sulfate adenylyltransferase subunit CysN [Polynucleobacter paneuropaeus]
MAHVSDLIASDIDSYLQKHQHKTLLRFITCGSVDDGKSTLIGRLLYDSHMLFDDQLAAIESDSKKWGTQGDQIDFALLVDGLAAEREQGITIDVAYRFFSTENRKFIVADTPGHEQYTRNMVTGASTADAAIVMIDARKGVLTQTCRHSYIANLLGIKHLLIAVNKMDLIDYSKSKFNEICKDYQRFAENLGIADFQFIPISAFQGDNITAHSSQMPWYSGPTLMEYLEQVPIQSKTNQEKPLRIPIQWVNRPNLDFRGFAGTIASGILKTGDRIQVQPSGKQSQVNQIISAEGSCDSAVAGQAITLTLTDEIDISRGNIISHVDAPAEVADQFEATLIWMHEDNLLPGRQYWLKIGTETVTATITSIKYEVNTNTLEHLAATHLGLNSIAYCNISLDRPIPFDAYVENRQTGGFILIDRITSNTVGAGLINFALRRSHNIYIQNIDINKAARAQLKHQTPKVIWFTGLSGSGKSTIANLVEKHLHQLGMHTYLLDGDNIRHGLNKDLGFTDQDRVENIRRIAEVAKLMVDAGLIVLTAFISPFRSERQMAREIFQEGEFIEVFIDTPLELAEKRDPKGLYKKARGGQLKNFTGIDSAYEYPENPELILKTSENTAEELAMKLCEFLNYRSS